MGPQDQNISFEDADLVRQTQVGDAGAFGQLVRKYQDRVFNLCVKLVGPTHDTARDLAQETFIRAYEAIERFESQSSFYTWLFRIAVNVSISHRRKDHKLKMVSMGHEHNQASRVGGSAADQAQALRRQGDRQLLPIDRMAQAETHESVTLALQTLDEPYRTILVLRDIELLDYQAIAEILDVPVGTVRSRLHRARMALRSALSPAAERVG